MHDFQLQLFRKDCEANLHFSTHTLAAQQKFTVKLAQNKQIPSSLIQGPPTPFWTPKQFVTQQNCVHHSGQHSGTLRKTTKLTTTAKSNEWCLQASALNANSKRKRTSAMPTYHARVRHFTSPQVPACEFLPTKSILPAIRRPSSPEWGSLATPSASTPAPCQHRNQARCSSPRPS